MSKYPYLFAELLADSDRWSEEDIAKLAGRNLIRVFRKVEEVSVDIPMGDESYRFLRFYFLLIR